MRLTLLMSVLLVACSAHEVRCDRRLQPINHPAPARAQDTRGAP